MLCSETRLYPQRHLTCFWWRLNCCIFEWMIQGCVRRFLYFHDFAVYPSLLWICDYVNMWTSRHPQLRIQGQSLEAHMHGERGALELITRVWGRRWPFCPKICFFCKHKIVGRLEVMAHWPLPLDPPINACKSIYLGSRMCDILTTELSRFRTLETCAL